MKSLLALILAALLVGGGALYSTFTAEVLPVPQDYAMQIPPARPPAGMRLSMVNAGKMHSQAGFAYRGGALGEPRVFGMGGVLVQHPQGNLLFDAGFGAQVDEHFKTIPLLMRATSKYEKEATAAEQLAKAGIKLKAVVLTHAHWDHVSGVQDLSGVPVWVSETELDFIRSGDPMTALARSFANVVWIPYEFSDGPYLGFLQSRDVFGDGSVVLVPAPGHTPGSIIAFVTLPGDQRYALVGDLVWQAEGIQIPAQRPWISRRLVDKNEEQVRRWIVQLHQLKRAIPGLVVVPAHDRRVAEALPQLGAAAVRPE